MKKIFILFILSAGLLVNTKAQKMQGTLKEIPGQLNTAIFALKSNQAFNAQFASVVFVVQIPADVIPKPTLTVSESFVAAFPAGSWVQESNTSGGFHNYVLAIATNNPPNTNVPANVEFDVIRFAFTGLPDLNLYKKIRVAHMADAGPETKYQFNVSVGGNDYTNYSKMFFSGSTSTSFPVSPLASEELGYAAYQYAESNNNILPVDFKSFYALKTNDDAKLSWDVSSDEKNDYFDVLRSIDGRTFKSIQRVKALDNGRNENSYQTSDLSLSKLGTREVYYQIQQFDKDGQSIKSPVRKLSIDGLGKSVTAFPNPARTTTKVVVDAPEAGKGSLIMRDAAGRQVQVVNAQFNRGINQFDMNVMSLSSGEYNIQVQGGGLNETIKVTKIN
jgi:hypothetical protein